MTHLVAKRSKKTKIRFALGFVLVSFLVVLTACSGLTPPSTAQTQPTPTSSAQAGQTVHVTLFDNRIESSMMTFTPGKPYYYVVTNKGSQPYTFAMMSQDREEQMAHMTPQQQRQAALFMSNTIAPGQTMMFNYTFTSSMMGMGQHLEFACYQQGQNQVHMRLPFD